MNTVTRAMHSGVHPWMHGHGWSWQLWRPWILWWGLCTVVSIPYLPTVLEHPGQSWIYCSCPLSHTQDATVRVFAETFPLLFCFSVTNAARKTQTQPRKIRKRRSTVFHKPMCVQTQPSSEETFDSWKKPSNLQCELRCKCTSEKRSKCQRHFFWTRTIFALNVTNYPDLLRYYRS